MFDKMYTVGGKHQDVAYDLFKQEQNLTQYVGKVFLLLF